MAYIAGAYWGQRKETREACATRISAFLQGLAQQDAALSQWFKQAMSRTVAFEPLPNDADALSPLLRTNRRDLDGEVIPELGFGFSAWTGRGDDMEASVSVTCGAYSPAIGNHVVLSFASAAAPPLDLLQAILRAQVSAFDPEDAVVNSKEGSPSDPRMRVWEQPALFRYKRGSGFSAD